jgi:hypothetical protein
MAFWTSLLVPVLIAVLTIAVNAVVNIKIKFAPSAEAATRDVKEFALRIFQWILNIGLVFVLLREVLSSEPLTRLAVFAIALQVTVLMLVIVMYAMNRVMYAFTDFFSSLHRVVESQAHGGEITKKSEDVLQSKKESADLTNSPQS